MQTSYHAWKSAVRKKYPECKFEGNKDICQAFNGRIGVGEWDGAIGEIFPPKDEGDFVLTWINPDSVPDLPILLDARNPTFVGV
jgi:hypothetical protein